jgi:hypothetical protein
MYIVKNSKGETVAICSEEQDAMAFKRSETVDKEFYRIEHFSVDIRPKDAILVV